MKLYKWNQSRLKFVQDFMIPSFRMDWNSSGEGKIVWFGNEIIAKRLTVYETQNMESICVEITFKKRKWEILFP